MPVEPPNAVFGQPVTFTAFIAPVLPSLASVPAAGTVSFFDGGKLIGTAQNIGGHGVATITTTGLAAGRTSSPRCITATASLTPPAPWARSHPPSSGPRPTSVQLASTPNPAGSGFPVTFTATVTPQAPSVVNPTGGTVQFYDGAVTNPADLLGAITNNATGNVFTFITTALSSNASPHTITAVYVTNGSYLTSASNPVVQTIIKSPTITITPSTTSPVFGQPVTYTIHLTDTPPSSFIPAGTVSLSVDGIAAAPSTPNPATLDATGTATFTGIALGSVGTHTIAIQFSSSDTVFATNNTSITQNVGQANTVTAVSARPGQAAVYGSAVDVSRPPS